MAVWLFVTLAVLLQALSSVMDVALGDSLCHSVTLSLLAWFYSSALAPEVHSVTWSLLPSHSAHPLLRLLPLCIHLCFCLSLRISSPPLCASAPLGIYPCVLSPPYDISWVINMPRERLRLVSRRGGSRGRAIHQHSSTTSDPSSDALESGRANYPTTRSGRGRGRGCARNDVCEHSAHPTARFHIPCSLANSSFIVSVTIEKCENAAHLGASAEQRRANPNVDQRQVTGGLSAVNPEVDAGPSAPAREADHPLDSSDSEQFGCKIVEEQSSTSVDK